MPINTKKLYGVTKGQLIVFWVIGIVFWIWSFFKIFVTYFAVVSSISWPRLSPATSPTFVILFFALPLILILYTIGWHNHKKHLAVSQQQETDSQTDDFSKDTPPTPTAPTP